ncbi:MAG: hypothetical protein ACHQ2Z_08795 [Elusimicrobiota bacterium]
MILFAAAFLMPAVKDSTPGVAMSSTYEGWWCAQFTLASAFGGIPISWMSPLIVLSGAVNPFVALYIAMGARPGLRLARRAVAAAVLAGLAAAWVVLAFTHMTPLVGHYLWVTGALLIVSPEFSGFSAILRSKNF